MSNSIRAVDHLFSAVATREGAGVRLKRLFGNAEIPRFDPFLLLDDFSAQDPADYLAGFPWHPHRGIETVTYMLAGAVEHGDSLGNSGVIEAGAIQWMSAGSGIIHQEMPRVVGEGLMQGFQLWVNLPASRKMSPPRYQEYRPDSVPTADSGDGCVVRVVAGEYKGVAGPVEGIAVDPLYLDVSLEPYKEFAAATEAEHTCFVYLFDGTLNSRSQKVIGGQVVLFGKGESVALTAGDSGARFIMVSGKPLKEPVAWYGPIVMNTQAELEVAFNEYQNGTFVK